MIIELTPKEALERFNANHLVMYANGHSYALYGKNPYISDIDAGTYVTHIDSRAFTIKWEERDWRKCIISREPKLVLADEGDIGKEVYVTDVEIDTPNDWYIRKEKLIYIRTRARDSSPKFVTVDNEDNHSFFPFAYRIPG